MAKAADVKAAIARELGRIDDCFRSSFCKLRVFAMKGDVLPSWSMTFFAENSQHEAVLAVSIHSRRHPFEIARMALEAARDDVLVEMRRAVGIARAVDPGVGF